MDEILIDELKSGDREAQRELYDLHASMLLAIAVRYVGERSVAEDILHDAFLKIFASIKRFNYRGEGSLRAWMCRIVVNCSLEFLRRRNKQTVMVDSIESAAELSCDESSNVETIPPAVLLNMIAELPEGYRTVLNLFCFEEYSHREIAQELGINEKSSSSQLLRAKRLLATKIKSYIESHE
ncbi:MAG: RNA polymerase sigma factor [Rikenellaceae bacterium]